MAEQLWKGLPGVPPSPTGIQHLETAEVWLPFMTRCLGEQGLATKGLLSHRYLISVLPDVASSSELRTVNPGMETRSRVVDNESRIQVNPPLRPKVLGRPGFAYSCTIPHLEGGFILAERMSQ